MKKDFSGMKTLLWGLDESTPEEELKNRVFDFVNAHHDFPTATVNHGQPESRIFGYDRLSDGYLYFMTSKGKPVYGQMKANPQVVLNSMVEDCFSMRIHAWVKEIGHGAEWDEFFELNPGTRKMYRFNPDIVALFRLEKGEGEIFHLYGADKVKRLRFGFGGIPAAPMTYYINKQNCIGCGKCFEACAEESIDRDGDGKCSIRNNDCDGCGICYTKCPLAGQALMNRIETEDGYYKEEN